MNIHIVVILILAATVLALGLTSVNLKDDLTQSERTLSRITRHLDSKTGGTSLLTGDMISYNLKTFDGGKHWYATEYDEDWGVIILGEAEEVYPGLLEHIKVMDKIYDRISTNGPLDLSISSDADLYDASGFTKIFNQYREKDGIELK